MKHKTAELTGALLDAAVAMIEGFDQLEGHIVMTMVFSDAPNRTFDNRPAYSTSWAHGGPIIERERIVPIPVRDEWLSYIDPVPQNIVEGLFDGRGPTPLISAMRAFVTSRLGDEVELP